MLLLSSALAASVSALVEVSSEGPVLLDAVVLQEDVRARPGQLVVLDADEDGVRLLPVDVDLGVVGVARQAILVGDAVLPDRESRGPRSWRRLEST